MKSKKNNDLVRPTVIVIIGLLAMIAGILQTALILNETYQTGPLIILSQTSVEETTGYILKNYPDYASLCISADKNFKSGCILSKNAIAPEVLNQKPLFVRNGDMNIDRNFIFTVDTNFLPFRMNPYIFIDGNKFIQVNCGDFNKGIQNYCFQFKKDVNKE